MDNKVVIRSGEEADVRFLEWYPAVFNQKSRKLLEDGKIFNEIIEVGAFDEVLRSETLNCKAVVDHDNSKLLARNKSGTLTLEVDDYGLKASARVGNTNLWKDIVDQVERGDYAEGSFKFRTGKGDSVYERDVNGDLIHRVRNVAGLYDVSIVGDGAYANTNVYLRSIDEFLEQETNELERKQAIQDELASKRNYIDNLKTE